VLPREEQVSFEYHLAGALTGLAAAILLYRLDPKPPRKRYSWEDEDEADEVDAELELPRPEAVPVLWRREGTESETGRVIAFPRRIRDEDGTHSVH
jgi:hypothetical protein